jgi:hypothetical protein
MNALTRHDVGQANTCGQHFHPHLMSFRRGALFLNHAKCIGAAIVGDDDARVLHTLFSRLTGYDIAQWIL